MEGSSDLHTGTCTHTSMHTQIRMIFLRKDCLWIDEGKNECLDDKKSTRHKRTHKRATKHRSRLCPVSDKKEGKLRKVGQQPAAPETVQEEPLSPGSWAKLSCPP